MPRKNNTFIIAISVMIGFIAISAVSATGFAGKIEVPTVIKRPLSARDMNEAISAEGLLDYTVDHFFIDGVRGQVVPGSGNEDGLTCPAGAELIYHMDISWPTSSLFFFRRSPPNIHILMRNEGEQYCRGPVVSTNHRFLTRLDKNTDRYYGTFRAPNEQKTDVYYEPCILTRSGYEKTDPYIATWMETKSGIRSCSK